MVLTKKNDIYVYFEVIRQLEPERILDIGMFLKRIGSVSRQVMEDCAISEQVILDGVDFWTEIDFPIWRTIYNHIINDIQLVDNLAERYDLAILFGTKELTKKVNLVNIVKHIERNTRYLLVDKINTDLERELRTKKIIPLNVNEDSYYLIDFGE